MGYAIQLRTVSLPAYVLLAGMLLLALTAPAGAQPPPTPAGVATPAAPPAPVVGGTSAGRFPAPPTGFFRGNSFANPTLTGFYFGWFRLIYLVGLFFLWVWTCRWIDEDAHGLKVRPMFWNTIALFGGTAGFVLALCMPAFPVAFLVMTTAYALPMGLYVYERNQRVPDSGKVLTPRHLKSVGLRLLGRLGIKFGTREVREAIGGPPIRLIGKSGKGAGEVDRSKQVESSGGYLAARELIYDAILRRTTDIHLEPKEDEIAVRLRVDGVMYPAEPFDRSTGDAIINIFKVLGAMDITERRKPQDGSFRAETEGRQIDFRVATQGVQFGEKMSLRILDQGSSVKTLPMLGLRKQLMEQVAEIVHQPHGMFLSCGPTGAGKSTTLYAALQEIDALESNIITIEDPVEYKMANVTQIEINTKAGQTFAGSLRSVLRQDPDVLLVGEIRDAETAKIACQASTTGHMVFSTLHANDTVTALFRLIDLGVEPFLLASSLSAILGQRLVRKLCEDCREPYRPDVELLHTLGLPAEKVDKFYRPPKSGNACPTCSGMGYFGRMGVFELLVMTDRLRDMIRETPNLAAIKAEARKNGMLYMIEEGLRLVVKGTTSLEELRRVAK
ncbi:GspE/PulE family protein [Planctellipticum variicoloris]|uniref:GspE/PulE family protein n=1 Tax=Planctellipticum variicoloris TaxID=3064265 RepID=UPI00301384CF|nr:GspE/PulE family protein [Planctomycetaceae bacterium SH412]